MANSSLFARGFPTEIWKTFTKDFIIAKYILLYFIKDFIILKNYRKLVVADVGDVCEPDFGIQRDLKQRSL